MKRTWRLSNTLAVIVVLTAAVGLTAAVPAAAGSTTSSGLHPLAAAQAICDPIDPAACLLPFPNDFFTVPDASSPTGLRVHVAQGAMPANRSGVRIDPTEWNRQDGFSPGEPILVHVPGLDVAKSGIAPVTDIGHSLAPNTPIELLNTRTGEPTPYWAELDAHATSQPDQQVLIIRPAVAMEEGTRYIVALRWMRDADGQIIPPNPVFAAFVDDRSAREKAANQRLVDMKRIFATLAQARIKRHDLYLAWDFTVASERDLTSRMLAIRDSAFQSLGGAAPTFSVTQVTDFTDTQNPRIARQVVGTVNVPGYLTGDGGPGSRLHYGPPDGSGLPPSPDAVPTATGRTIAADFVCNIPRVATSQHPAHLSLYGHGLFGQPTEINAGNVKDMSQRYNFMFCATSWIGMADADIGYFVQSFMDFSGFPAVPDRMQQGFLDFLFLGRAMDRPAGFASNAAFQDADGHPLIDVAGGLHYDGNSQGGIAGGALTAIAQDWTRSVLGVTGMNYSTLVQRSVDGAPFQQLLDTYYPGKVDQQLVFALLQMLWDRSEADGYAQHMTTDPLPGTPAHQVLMHVAFGDHQVSTATAEVEARTIGARLHTPALAPGWSDAVVPFWGIPPIAAYPYGGSAMVVWNSGKAFASPPTNLAPADPNIYGQDPHEFPRAQPEAQQQKAIFLLSGLIVDVCNGGPCP